MKPFLASISFKTENSPPFTSSPTKLALRLATQIKDKQSPENHERIAATKRKRQETYTKCAKHFSRLYFTLYLALDTKVSIPTTV